MPRYAALVAVLLVAPPALADWTGKITTTQQLDGQAQPGAMTGRISVRKDKVRFEISAPMRMVMLLDGAQKKMIRLDDAARTWSEMDLSQAQAQQSYPACADGDVDACLAQQGWKKTGSGEANGHPCDVYEGGPAKSGKAKLWRPKDLKEAAMVRMVQTDGGRVTQIDITDVKTAPLPDATFQVPAGYAKQESMVPGLGPRGVPAMPPGMTPEQYREMLMKQFGGKK